MALQSDKWWVTEKSPDWLLTAGCSKPATSHEADGVHGCNKHSNHVWPSRGQREEIMVGRSHSPQLPMEVISSEGDIDFLQQAPALCFASKVFDGMQQHGSMHSMFDTMPLEVTWDEEIQADINTHQGLLQQLALGVDDENTKHTVDCQDVVCDAELLEGIDCQDGQLQQLVHGEDYQMQCKKVHPMLSKSDAGLEFDELPHKDVIWDEDMQFNLDKHEEWLQQLALGSDYLIKENTKPIVVRGVDEMLELKVVDDDKSNGNLQLGEHEAYSVVVLPSTESGCAADHFSPQSPKQNGKDNLFLILYEACVGLEMNCDHQNLVIFEERQEKGSARYVITGTPSWKLNAFSTTNGDMEVAHLVVKKIPSWRRTGFSPGSYELKRTLSDIFNTQLSDQDFKSALFLDTYVLGMEYQGCISIWQWDPGICSYHIMGLFLRISEISVLIQFIQKSSEIFSLQLLPGTVGMKECDPELDDCGISSSMWVLTIMLIVSLQYHLVLGMKHSPHGKQEPSIQYKSQQGNGFCTELIIEKLMYVPADQLSEGVAVWLTFPIDVNSRKQGVNSLDSAYMAPNAKELLLVILLIIRPWDPGIYKFNFNRSIFDCRPAQILQESWTAKIE